MWRASVLNVLIPIKDLCLTRCCQYWNIIQLANLTDMEHNAVIKPHVNLQPNNIAESLYQINFPRC